MLQDNRVDLGRLYEELVPVCTIFAKRFDFRNASVIAHDASTRIIERFLVDDSYEIKNMYGLAFRAVQSIVRNSKTKDASLIFEENQNNEYENSLEDLFFSLSENPRHGRKIIAILYDSCHKKTAYKKISAIKGQRWLYEYAEALGQLFEVLR